MKHNIFKIRRVGEQNDPKESSERGTPQKNSTEIDSLKASIQSSNQKMMGLMSMFETFMKVYIQQTPNGGQGSQIPQAGKIESQVRDRHVELPLPNTDTVTHDQTQKWITNLCVTAFSTSFHYFITEQMTFEQTKVFCSENILRNLLLFTSKYKLSDKQIENINKHIGQKVFQYLQKKYPLTQSNDINKALQREVQQTNHLELLTNDFLYAAGLMFVYSPDGNYNDMIMKTINKAIEIAQQTSLMANIQEENKKQEEISNYNDFHGFVSDLFEKVYDQQWMVGSRAKADRTDSQATYIAKKVNQGSHKQKYEEKVRNYTNYLIGRKISQNTVPYTQAEIKSKNLIIKSPAILRILTKWCQQLWEKFQSENYFTSKTQSIQLQNPEIINPFFKWMKQAIDKLAIAEKKAILIFKEQLDRNSYNHQSEFLLKHLQQDGVTCIPKLEQASGKFATQTVKNLHSYITLYLNRLIHGLLTVSKNFYDKQIDKSWDDWKFPPNLITFKIGDLIRCKMSSKEKEIVKVFREIKRISNINPKKMKIVRIKNRLKQGTNDILINVKFNNLIVCEIQLQVINKSKTKFIQCSNAFSHYIYEMKRSIFGPVSQLCNIWNNYQVRAQEYQSLIDIPKILTNQKVECLQGNIQHSEMVKYDLPFQCSYCKKLYYHNNYIIPNKKCKKCNKYKCVKCQINDIDPTELKKVIFRQKKDRKLSDSCSKIKQRIIPSVGVCVKIESTFINIQVFKFTKKEGKVWLLGKRDDQIYNIKRILSPKNSEQFLDQYCIFEITLNSQQFINITDKMVQNFAIEEYVKDSYKQEKEVLILTQIRYKVPELIELMKVDGGFQRNKRKIRRIQFASNYVSDISYFSCFENLTAINLDFNDFTNLKDLCNFKQLQKLQMRDNGKLVTFDEEFCQLTRIEEIKISAGKIASLPQKIGNLSLLTIIKIDKSCLKIIPNSFCNLVNLKDMSFECNQIEVLPDEIGKMINLRKISLKQNKLTVIPTSIGQLTALQILDLSRNYIKDLPQSMMYLTKLEILRLSFNKFENILPAIPALQYLKVFDLNDNQLKMLPDTFACKNLQSLLLHTNELSQLPQKLGQCTKLSQLSLRNNKFQAIPDFVKKFRRLSSVIDLKCNKLTEFPPFIFELQNVTKILLQQNSITSIPPQISTIEDLVELNITKNKLQALTPQLTSLNKLTIFSFQHNQIKKVPAFIKDISTIKKDFKNWYKHFENNKIQEIQSSELIDVTGQVIKLTFNELPAFPMSVINNKEKITVIDFNKNKIKQIPKEITLFINLRSLNLTFNLIEIIPKELQQLLSMQENNLNIHQNPLKQIQCAQYCLNFGSYETQLLIQSLENAKSSVPIEKAQ